jgi:hypothetical protein
MLAGAWSKKRHISSVFRPGSADLAVRLPAARAIRSSELPLLPGGALAPMLAAAAPEHELSDRHAYAAAPPKAMASPNQPAVPGVGEVCREAGEALVRSSVKRRHQRLAWSTRAANAASGWGGPDCCLVRGIVRITNKPYERLGPLQSRLVNDENRALSSRRGFQKVSIRPVAGPPRTAPGSKSPANVGNPREPSDGLEPSTPSLPSTPEGLTGDHTRPSTGANDLQMRLFDPEGMDRA